MLWGIRARFKIGLFLGWGLTLGRAQANVDSMPGSPKLAPARSELCEKFFSVVSGRIGLRAGSPWQTRLSRGLTPLLAKTRAAAQWGAAVDYARRAEGGKNFATHLAEALRINVASEADLAKIPKRGSLVVVANHALGFADGISLLAAYERARPGEVKIMTVGAVPELINELAPYSFAIGSRYQITRRQLLAKKAQVDAAQAWVAEGKVLIVFPSGYVARRPTLSSATAIEIPWEKRSAEIIEKTGADFQSVFVSGQNPRVFDAVGRIHHSLSLLTLPFLIDRVPQSNFSLSFAERLPAEVLRARTGGRAKAQLLRELTEAEAPSSHPEAEAPSRHPEAEAPSRHPEAEAPSNAAETAAAPGPRPLTADQVQAAIANDAAGPPLEQGSWKIFSANAAQSPEVAAAVQRLREDAFSNRLLPRAPSRVLSDVVAWDGARARLAGAFRMARVVDLIAAGERPIVEPLFEFPAHYFDDPRRFELGGAVVDPDYRNSRALLLLLHGVQISGERQSPQPIFMGRIRLETGYADLSRQLLARFINRRSPPDFRPRYPLESPVLKPEELDRLLSGVHTIKELDALVRRVETDGKGLPPMFDIYARLLGPSLRWLAAGRDPGARDLNVLLEAMPTPRGP